MVTALAGIRIPDMGSAPYLVRLQLRDDAVDGGEYPFSLALIRVLDREFTSPVTFFVGENGTGKSTVIVAIAIKRNAPPRRSKPTWG